MTGEAARPLGYGETVPGLSARTTKRAVAFPNLAGHDRILVFVAGLGGPDDAGRFAACRSAVASQKPGDPLLMFVSTDSPDMQSAALSDPMIDGRVLLDRDGRVAAGFRIPQPAGDAAVIYLLDRALRVADRRSVDRLGELIGVLDAWRERPAAPQPQRRSGTYAPVLLIDKVFEPAFSLALIGRFEATGGVESGFMVRDGEFTRGRMDPKLKRRRDMYIDEEVIKVQCRKRLQLRLHSMVEAAFRFRATHIERYLVARYDSSDRGEFRAHRDNDTSGTAHRRFAVTVNLNDGYDGGYLRFPEFGDDLYRPSAGSAAVFSCSLVHEATPVTAGTRYAFLTFLFDDRDAAVMRENEKLVVSDPR